MARTKARLQFLQLKGAGMEKALRIRCAWLRIARGE
jgi:hypothetical protein